MDKTQALTLIASWVLIAVGYFIYKVVESNNDKEKFLAQQKMVDSAIKALERTTIEVLKTRE